jgi:hypothetical protein
MDAMSNKFHLRVICPQCNEDIGICEGEQWGETLQHGERIAFFRCHYCGECWEVTPTFTAVQPGADDE